MHDPDLAILVVVNGVGEVLGAFVHDDHLTVVVDRLPLVAHNVVNFDLVRGVVSRRVNA